MCSNVDISHYKNKYRHTHTLQSSKCSLLFGFLLLSPLPPPFVGPQNRPSLEDDLDSTIRMHDLIKSSGVPNYCMVRAPVKSTFDINLWRKLLVSYSDHLVLDYLEYGFPLDSNLQNYVSTIDNHPSAKSFPKDVSRYFDQETKMSAMLGPFSDPPFRKLHCSPLLTRPKDTLQRRVIVNLSWPGGDSINSNTNTDYDNFTYSLTLPSIDDVASRVLELGPKALIYKVDIRRAFRNFKMDPADVDKLGLYWQNKYYVDLSLAFGYAHGSAICQRVTDAVRFICQNHDIWTVNYIDDFIGVDLPGKAEENYLFLKNLLLDLGFQLSVEKLVDPSHEVTCIGITINTITRTLSIDRLKILQVQQSCHQWKFKKQVRKNELQSLLGRLIYIARCVKPARIFLGRMLALLRDNHSNNKIVLTTEFFKDLMWFNKFVSDFNGTVLIYGPQSYYHIFVDACLEGAGAKFNTQVYAKFSLIWEAIQLG